jgi:hypothetical protein
MITHRLNQSTKDQKVWEELRIIKLELREKKVKAG